MSVDQSPVIGRSILHQHWPGLLQGALGLPSTTWVTPKSMMVVTAVMAWSSVRLKARIAKSRVLLYATVNAMSRLDIW